MMLAMLSSTVRFGVCLRCLLLLSAAFAFLSFARVHFPAAAPLTIRRTRAHINSRLKSKETIEQSGVECGCKEI